MQLRRIALAAALLAACGAAPADEASGAARVQARAGPPPIAWRHAPAPRIHASPRMYWYMPLPWYDPWLWYPWRHYPDPWHPYAPQVITVPSAAPVYIERGPGEDAPAAGYWYWCGNPAGYYPTVPECPGGWLQVPPRPSDTR